MPKRILVAGVSTRALAESATRAGYAVLSIDAFGDLDHPATPALSLVRDFSTPYSAHAIARAARSLDCDAVAYTASFENHPRAVELLSHSRTLLGNVELALKGIRNPLRLATTLRHHGFPTPDVRASGPHRDPAAIPDHNEPEWLAKPRASGGGHGITPWQPRHPLPRTHILQERIAGIPGSIAFFADGRHATPFALTRQMIGDPAFGASGFKYCGSILTPRASALAMASDIAHALTESFHLVGANGLDFIDHDGVPYIVEANPRYSASMELGEHAFGIRVFDAHARACHGDLARFDLAAALRDAWPVGKAILFARHTITVGDTRAWLDDNDIRDIPHPGERILRGRPICTIFARGRDEDDCYARLVHRARILYEEIDVSWRRSA